MILISEIMQDIDFTIANEKVVVMSDLHLNHNRDFLYGKRGFQSSTDHSKFIFDCWEKYIDKDTVVINLGDLAFDDSKAIVARKYLSLPFKHQILITGNHNSGVKTLVNEEYFSYMRDMNVTVQTFAIAKIEKTVCNLFHFPMMVWNQSHKGTFCLCGHSHGSLVYTNPNRPEFGKLGRVMDCGVECAMEYTKGERFFFYFNEIQTILKSVPVRIVDHHNSTTN